MRPTRDQVLLVVSSVGLAIAAAFAGYLRKTYDAYSHMFLGDHYLRDWFSLWNTRWYGGFTMTAYPPLGHQVEGALAALVGHEASFLLWMAVAMTLLPIGVAALASHFVAAPWHIVAGGLALLVPASYRIAYANGQLPHMLATVAAVFAMAAAGHFAKTHSKLCGGLAIALMAVTSATHHVTAIFALGGSVATIVAVTLPKARRVRDWIPAAMVLMLGAIAIFAVVWPFWSFALHQPVQTEIPHYSRFPLHRRLLTVEGWGQLAVTCIAIMAVVRSWRCSMWGLCAFALFVLGFEIIALGPTTPLPELLFGEQARWLTYEKFHHWAFLCACVLAAWLIPQRWERYRTHAIAGAVVLLVGIGVSTRWELQNNKQPAFISDISPMLKVLGTREATQYRHLTLGMGDQFPRLGLYTDAPSADGNYYTARPDPFLRQSGIGSLDSARLFRGGMETLTTMLGRANELSLRYVFVNHDAYLPVVMHAGFVRRAVWKSGIAYFENPKAPPIPPHPPEERTLWHWLWGILPPLSLVVALCFGGMLFWRSRSTTSHR